MSSSHELVCNLRSSYQPPLEGIRVVCKTYRPSTPLAASIILLMCLIDGDCREDPVGLLNREIALNSLATSGCFVGSSVMSRR